MIDLTIILVIMTGIISYQAFNNTAMKHKLMFHPVSVKKSGEWYRFISHGFVHANWEHLLINLFVLWQFGTVIEGFFNAIFSPAVGRVAFLFLYFSAIVIAAIPSYIRHGDNNYYASLGASGATSALVFAYILINPWGWFLFPPLPAIFFGVAYLWYSSYMGKRGGDNIAHDAHLWGAVYGLVFTLTSALALQPVVVQRFINELLAGPSLPNF
ncbi:MAG: rhomboid family intramembrane serine protease [Saprospiraceae bacterium]|nr:rhomboid family intramembrane serine protease [Saprospiraceae bacterium]